jgi:Flp pilus assembly CpaF family ATPase
VAGSGDALDNAATICFAGGAAMSALDARELRATIAEQLAGGSPANRSDPRSFARHLAEAVLDERAREAVAAGRPPSSTAEDEETIEILIDMLFGLGSLQRLIEDPSVENIDVNGADEVWVTYADGAKEQGPAAADSDEALIELVRAAAGRFGLSERRFDAGEPELDLRLPDGSRLSAVMAVTRRPVVDIRRHRLANHSLGDLVDLGMFDEELACFLAAAVRAKRNILVSGAMNSGKTTMLRALATEISPRERIVTIERALELGLDHQRDRHPDCVAMEARPANIEGVGAIGVAQLVRRSLRMNAARVIVGEVLGDEVIPMLNAMSQGRSGSMATIHADSSASVFRRLATYAIQAPERLPLEATNLLIAGSIHLVVHLDARPVHPESELSRVGPGRILPAPLRRCVSSVREVVDADGGVVVSNELWRPRADGVAAREAPPSEATLQALSICGYDWGPDDAAIGAAW